MEQRKTESINQFTRRVEQRFKRLRALYPGQYDCDQLWEGFFSRNACTLEGFNEIPLYEGRSRL